MDEWIVTFISGTSIPVQAVDVQHDGDWIDLLDEKARPLWSAPMRNVLYVERAQAPIPTASTSSAPSPASSSEA